MFAAYAVGAVFGPRINENKSLFKQARPRTILKFPVGSLAVIGIAA